MTASHLDYIKRVGGRPVGASALSNMSYERWWTGRWWCNEWRCCGLAWQILLSRLYPEREYIRPICPNCGAMPNV